MTGNIFVEHDSVEQIGRQLGDTAHRARATTNRYFDSQRKAADDNPGFTTGGHLVSYADKLHHEINGCLDSLSDNARSIVEAGQAYALAEQQNTCLLNDNVNPTGSDPGLSMDFQALRDVTANVSPGLSP